MNRVLCKTLLFQINELMENTEPTEEMVAKLSKLYIELIRMKNDCTSVEPEQIDPLYISALGALSYHFSKVNEN